MSKPTNTQITWSWCALLIGMYGAGTSERKISFALGGDDDSQHSSNTELNNVDQQAEEKKGKYTNIIRAIYDILSTGESSYFL